MQATLTGRALPLFLVLLLPGCGRKTPPPAPVPAAESSPAPTPVAPPNDDTARRARDAEEARLRDEAARMRSVLEQMVFFDYDRADVRGDARASLEAKVPILRNHPEIRLRIEGHADERGSAEYNLALGLRRAESVRLFLSNFSIGEDRTEVASYGEERPLATGTDVSTFARNRRAQFRVLGGLAQ